MRAKSALLPVVCLVATLAPLAAQEKPAASADAERMRRLADLVNKPVVYTVPGMDQVQVKKDLVYKPSEDPAMKMDVYEPPGLAATERRPAVIFLHGGARTAFRPKDWGFYQSWGRLVAASGMVGVTFTYRISFPADRVADSAADVADAIAYVRAHAGDLGVDKDRLCLAAYSAGGPMLSPYLRGAPVYVRCLVGFYPLMDLGKSEEHAAGEPAETIARFSPVARIAQGTDRATPLLLAQGGKDEVPTLLDSVDRFVAAALDHGVPLTLLFHPDAPHAFDNQLDDDRTREIVRGALDFLRWHLGVK
ncbi:MAG TPA: alpha/beta hydrolase [Thermoanaerobaculia bacterium]